MKSQWIFIIIILLSCSKGMGKEKPFPAPVEKAQKSVVKVSGKTRFRLTKGGFRTAVGTGFFIDRKTVVTNFHVIFPMSPKLPVYVENERGKFQVKRVKYLSALYDLAVLEVETPGRRMPFLERARPRKGSPFYIFGYPQKKFFRFQGRYAEQKGTDLILFSNNIPKDLIMGGASGSPILNGQGKVVGILKMATPNILVGVSVKHLEELLKKQPLAEKSLKILVRNEFERVRELAHQGNALAQFFMGYIARSLRKYYPVKISKKQSHEWVQESANQGHDVARTVDSNMLILDSYEIVENSSYLTKFILGISFFIKSYKSESLLDRKKVFEMISAVAEGGLNQAQFITGLMLERGFGVRKDKKKAIQWIKKAVNQGYEPAQNYLNQEPLLEHSKSINSLLRHFVYEDTDWKLLFSTIRAIVPVRRARKKGIMLPLLVNFVETTLVKEIQYSYCQQSISSLN